MAEINIAIDYSKTPGGRYRKDGKYSGQDFREKILIPKYQLSIRQGEKLIINLDGGYGYGSSFLEEAFGGLVRELDNVDINSLIFISNEEPQLLQDINKYLIDAINTKKGKKK